MKFLVTTILCIGALTLVASGQDVSIESVAKVASIPAVEYPYSASLAGIGGRVVVKAKVALDGELLSAEVTGGPGPICREVALPAVLDIRDAALAAVRGTKFYPVELDTMSSSAPDVEAYFMIDFPKPLQDADEQIAKTGKDRSKKSGLISMGVMNGKARRLPKPIFPAAARAVRAYGKVEVQVVIDEDGNVFSAEAISGHPLLRSAGAVAACGAKFAPTIINAKPIRISGILTYNFVP